MFISRPTFNPQLEYLTTGLSDLCTQILKFCHTKGQCGASQREIKVSDNQVCIQSTLFYSV